MGKICGFNSIKLAWTQQKTGQKWVGEPTLILGWGFKDLLQIQGEFLLLFFNTTQDRWDRPPALQTKQVLQN